MISNSKQLQRKYINKNRKQISKTGKANYKQTFPLVLDPNPSFWSQWGEMANALAVRRGRGTNSQRVIAFSACSRIRLFRFIEEKRLGTRVYIDEPLAMLCTLLNCPCLRCACVMSMYVCVRVCVCLYGYVCRARMAK